MGLRGPLPRESDQSEFALVFDGEGVPPPLPEPPAWFGSLAREEYNRVVHILGSRLTGADFGLLCGYAQAYEEVATHPPALAREGYFFEGHRGAVQNPRVKALVSARKMLVEASAALGLTPSSRQRLASIPKSGPAGAGPLVGSLPGMLPVGWGGEFGVDSA